MSNNSLRYLVVLASEVAWIMDVIKNHYNFSLPIFHDIILLNKQSMIVNLPELL